MTASPEVTPSTPRQVGDDALQLASELTNRIARERDTVRALKEHVLASRADDRVERLRPPQRQAPAHAPAPASWQPLGECLVYRRADAVPHAVCLELSGEIDLSGALRLRQLVSDVLDKDTRELTLDMAEVSFVDSNALSALLWVRRRAMLDEIPFSIRAVHPQVRRLLTITKLDVILLG